MQKLAAKLVSENDWIILFVTTAENKVLLLHNGTHSLSCGGFFKEHLGMFNGKGGGKDQSAQAGFASSDDALGFFQFATEEIKRTWR